MNVFERVGAFCADVANSLITWFESVWAVIKHPFDRLAELNVRFSAKPGHRSFWQRLRSHD